jgi:serine protease
MKGWRAMKSIRITLQALVWVALVLAAFQVSGQMRGGRNAGVTVAVIDSGVNPLDSGLKNWLLPGYNMVSSVLNGSYGRSNDFSPQGGRDRCTADAAQNRLLQTHGTEVARMLLAGSLAFEKMSGMLRILPVRIYGNCKISRADMLDAIAWSAGFPVAGLPLNPHPAKVLNLSFSGGTEHCGADLQQLINRLVEANIFLVVAAGNSYHKTLREPANCDGAIVVGAVNEAHQIEDYSALDQRIDVYAFGGKAPVEMANPQNNRDAPTALAGMATDRQVYSTAYVGTSFAAPLVSGLVAQWALQNPHKTVEDFRASLVNYTLEIAPPKDCSQCRPRSLM